MTKPSETENLLIPYVNGTATREQAARVEDAMRSDPALTAECRYLRALRRAVKTPVGDTPGEFGLERLRRSIARHAREQRRLWFWRRLTALAATLLLAVSAVHLHDYSIGDDSFLPLQASMRDTVQVRFQPTATHIEMQTLLRALGLEIVSGPSAVGVYRLRLRQADSPAARAETLARLREQRTLIEFAELDP